MLLDTSLRREMARNFGGSFTVLFSVVLTLMLIRLLGQASEGQADPSDLFLLIGLASLSYLQFIVGLALFIAVLMTFSRMYRDSEMSIWAGAGVAPLRLFRVTLRFAAPIVAVIAVLTLVAWPWANRQTSTLRERFEQRSDVARATPGQFRQSASGRRVFFVGAPAAAGGLARNVFIRELDDGRETITLAHAARLQDQDGARYLMLDDGSRYSHAIGSADYQATGFVHMGVRLSSIEARHNPALPAAARLAATPSREIPTLLLAASPVASWRGELSWRIGVPLSSLLLVLMALPLAASNPRAGRAMQLVAAVLLYLTYLNFLNAAQRWVEDGALSLGAALLVLHGCAAAILLALTAARGMISLRTR